MIEKDLLYEPYIYQSCADGISNCCIHKVEILSVLEACHSTPIGGHHSSIRTCIRSCSVGIIFKPFTKILTIPPNHFIGANEMQEFQRGDSFH